MIFDDAFWRGELSGLVEIVLVWVTRSVLASVRQAVFELSGRVFIDWDAVNTDALRFAETYTYELVNGINATSREFLQREISAWIESGEPLPKLVERIDSSGMFGEMRSQMIAVTEVTRAYTQGNLIAWKESGVVDGKRWETVNDEKVCPVCGPMEGKEVGLYDDFILPDGKEVDGPPAHVRCRCRVMPVVRL